jgi:hypothetical protein
MGLVERMCGAAFAESVGSTSVSGWAGIAEFERQGTVAGAESMRRIVPLPDAVVDALKLRREQQESDRLAAGVEFWEDWGPGLYNALRHALVSAQ